MENETFYWDGLRHKFFRLLALLPNISMNKDFVEFTDCLITLNHLRSSSKKVTYKYIILLKKNF